MTEIFEGNRPGEPAKPFSMGLTGEYTLLAKPVGTCNIEVGTIQSGFFFKEIGSSDSGGAGLAFFVQVTGYDQWTMYIAELYVYGQKLRFHRYVNGTKTTLLDIAFTIPLNQIVWLGVDFSHYSENGAGLLKLHATTVEGNIIRADTLKATLYDPVFTPGGSVGIYNDIYGNRGRVVDLTAGSPAHAEFADEARALRGTILAGDNRRVRYNEVYNRFEWSDDGLNWTAVTADPGGSVGDMLKSTYDQDEDGVVDAAESAPWAGITGKPSTYPPDSHTHDWAGITGKPAAFPPDVHNHDDRYYTEAEVDDLIAGVEGGGLTLDEYGNLEIPGTLSALTLASTIPDGPTPPLSITSRKVVPNLNAELWQGFEPADLICIGVQKTVGPSGRDFTSIQSAINWFAHKVCIQCSIAVDPGTYSEYITINGTSHAVTVTDLQILGDSRPFAGTSYVHGEPCNRVGASYLGSGSVTLSSSGNSITVTAAGGSPNFNSAGVVSGDTIVCRTSVGGWSTLTISSVSNNVLNCASAAPGNFNAAGAVLTFLPNRRIQPPSTQNQTLMTIQHNKVNMRGFDILGTSTSHYNVDCSQSVVVGMYNCTVRNGYGLVISYSSHLYNWNQPLSIVNCTYGVIAQQAAMAILCYSYAIGSSQGAGYLAQFGGTIDAYATVACGWAAGYLCQLQAFLKADSSGATKCGVGFQSSYNSYIYAVNTSAYTVGKGNTTDYTPAASDTEGNVYGIITRS